MADRLLYLGGVIHPSGIDVCPRALWGHGVNDGVCCTCVAYLSTECNVNGHVPCYAVVTLCIDLLLLAINVTQGVVPQCSDQPSDPMLWLPHQCFSTLLPSQVKKYQCCRCAKVCCYRSDVLLIFRSHSVQQLGPLRLKPSPSCGGPAACLLVLWYKGHLFVWL